MAVEKLVVTVPEAAALTSVGRSTGYALVASGEWPSITIGRSVRVPVEALRAWVERRMRATESASAMAPAVPVESAPSGKPGKRSKDLGVAVLAPPWTA